MTNRWNRKHRRGRQVKGRDILPLPLFERAELEDVARMLCSYDAGQELTPALIAELVRSRGVDLTDLQTMAELGMRWNPETESFWAPPECGGGDDLS